MAAAGGRQVLSDGGGLHTLLSLRQQAASSTATKAPRLLSFVHRPPTRRGDRARRARPEDFAGDVRPGGGGGGSRRRAGGLNAIASGSDSAAAAASASFMTCQGVEGIGARAAGSATDGRRRRRFHPGACGGAACPACGANHRGLLRWKRPVVQDPAGGFVSAAADRHAFPGRAAGRRGRVVGDAPHDLETGPRDLTGN